MEQTQRSTAKSVRTKLQYKPLLKLWTDYQVGHVRAKALKLEVTLKLSPTEEREDL